MITGLGIDVVEVARIERAMRRPGFLQRILTPAEQALDLTPSRVAGRWAAKEALAKAIDLALTWQDIEILNDAQGKPVVTFANPPKGLTVHVSISHERGLAAAVAVVEEASGR